MAFQLLAMAERRWRRVNGAHLIPLVRAGVRFIDGAQAESRKGAQEAIARFEADYGAKYPKAVASLRRDEVELLTFFDFPAEHWVHLRTGNVIESPFATVRLRQRVTKGAGSRQKGLLMAFKLLLTAQERWRRISAAHLIPLVRAGIGFNDSAQAGRSAA